MQAALGQLPRGVPLVSEAQTPNAGLVALRGNWMRWMDIMDHEWHRRILPGRIIMGGFTQLARRIRLKCDIPRRLDRQIDCGRHVADFFFLCKGAYLLFDSSHSHSSLLLDILLSHLSRPSFKIQLVPSFPADQPPPPPKRRLLSLLPPDTPYLQLWAIDQPR